MGHFKANVSETISRALITAGQRTPFRGRGGHSARPEGGGGCLDARFPQAEIELARVAEFFQFFREARELIGALRGKRVLDFGCGYGGRTVGYATTYRAAEVVGVEPFPHVVEKCRAFAKWQGVSNCKFLLNDQTTIPLPDSSIDVAVSYDVFEHVANPAAMLFELRRVLVPGGRIYIVFTPYFGAFSHHLNYITLLPGLHWIFNPQTLINSVNRILRNGGSERFGTSVQPDAPLSFGGKRRCLPGINGLTGTEFLALCRDFRIVETHSTPLLARFRVFGRPGAWLNTQTARVGPRFEEALSFNMVCVLEK